MTDQATMVHDGIRETYDRVRREYGGAIGRHRSEVVTPALILDLPAAKRNIAHMAERLLTMPAKIRPHIKVHKSPELSRLQVEAGAIGLSVATVWEAIVLVDTGLDHIFVVNTVAGPDKLRALAELARDADIMVAVDDPTNAESLSNAAVASASELGVFIEVDTGMDRCGVDSPEEALSLARGLVRLPGLRFMGLTGYEGHCSLTPETDLRHARQRAAMAMLAGIADLLVADGIPCPILSAGGTATWDWTAADPRITEIQAGTYVIMDVFHGSMVGGFENWRARCHHRHQPPAGSPGPRRREQVDRGARAGPDRRARSRQPSGSTRSTASSLPRDARLFGWATSSSWSPATRRRPSTGTTPSTSSRTTSSSISGR